MLAPDAWVSPGQWGEDWWYLLLFIGTGGIVLNRVGRWDTSVAFFGTYAGLEAARNLWLGYPWDVYAHRLSSGSLLLFALFMITDPRSIPNARSSRIIWAISIAGLTFILRNYFYINEGVFFALFIISPLTILLDRLLSAPQFNWNLADRKLVN
jgi:Na+-transporting NADH:ubiquinone oxidoreductase subunit NqrB